MKVGTRTVLLAVTLFVLDGEVAELEVPISTDDSLKLKLTCPLGVIGEGKPVISYELVDGTYHFSFSNFTEPGGVVTNTVTAFAQSKIGSPIYYFAAGYKTNTATKIELQVMMGTA